MRINPTTVYFSGINPQKIQSAPTIKRLPFLFLDEKLSREETSKEIGAFKYFVRNGLYPQQKILWEYKSYSPFYTVDNFVHSPIGYTDGIFDCISVLLNNKDDAFLLHLSPDNYEHPRDILYMQNKIAGFIDDLEKNNQKCAATLFGGKKVPSQDLHKNIGEILDKKGVKPDEILYDNSHRSHSIYYDVREGIVLDNHLWNRLDDLKTSFEVVNINPR